MARLLADEHIPLCTVELLREMGHDVEWVCEAQLQGTEDDLLRDLAVSEQRVTVSFNDYFAQRAFFDNTHPSGVITQKFQPKDTADIDDRVGEAVACVEDFTEKHTSSFNGRLSAFAPCSSLDVNTAWNRVGTTLRSSFERWNHLFITHLVRGDYRVMFRSSWYFPKTHHADITSRGGVCDMG